MKDLNETYKPILVDGKEQILSLLELEYFGSDEKGDKPFHEDMTCILCKSKGISLGAASFNYETGEIQPVCYDCENLQFAKRYGYNDITAATNRRRRIFDVHYLFVEKLAKEYEKIGEFSNEDWEDEELEKLFLYAQKVWAKLPKSKVVKLELTLDQKKIEKELDKLIDSNNYIIGLTVFLAMDLDEFGDAIIDA
jgi:hypothetical protein